MHTFPIQIRFNDVDILGHVNNVMYGHYFDMARYQFMIQKFGDLVDLRHSRYIFIMVRTEYDFLQPSFMEERLHVETSMVRVGNKSIQFKQSIVDNKGVVKVNCVSVMSSFDKESGTSFEISPEWKAALEGTPL
jgi:acyl-CoA thioester hydrolase